MIVGALRKDGHVIDPLRDALALRKEGHALRKEGHVDTGREAISGLVKEAISTFQVHASRAEHGPPGGGQKSKTTEPLRNSHVRKLQVPTLDHTQEGPQGPRALARFVRLAIKSVRMGRTVKNNPQMLGWD